MAKGYWIARVDIHNDGRLQAYIDGEPGDLQEVSAAASSCAAASSKRRKAPRAVAQRGDRVSGLRHRARLLQFAGIPEANIAVRQPHALADIVIIEGYDGPQP